MPVSVLICYRNPSSANVPPNCSHGGLGCNAMWTVKMLTAAGIPCQLAQTWDAPAIAAALKANPATHCVIEAMFVAAADLKAVVTQFPKVRFLVRCHSQAAFLATAPADVVLLRACLTLQDNVHNLQVSGNSKEFCEGVEGAYRQTCVYLPNAYVTNRPGIQYLAPKIHQDTIKVGCFGAIRVLKNQATAALAALYAARILGKQLEFHMNGGRTEHGGGVLASIEAMFAGLPWAKLVFDGWSDWGTFRQTISTMSVCAQLSSTETFNLVTADACAEGISSVVGDAIEWAPPSWRASIDDPTDAGRKMIELLNNPLSVVDGQRALAKYCADSLQTWKTWLGV